MATQGKRFGQKPRPLIEDLKGILERYPDGGQILKELIQNADDAGAEKVFFVYDPKEYSTKNLLDEKLKPFQGPSLLVYNDAIFTDEDWDNIEMLGRSYKKSDPFKVGRFGLGFNAVYHLTDLPMILSGDRFGVLEPSEELFLVDGVKSSGMAWSINQLMRQDDQFSPFREMIDRVTQKRRGQIEKFPGTIFRFPLRKQSSKMSKTVYGEEKIEKLFESFKLESKKIILFLNNVRSIKVTNLNQEKNSLLIMSIFDDTNSNKAQREFVQERTKNKICGENLVLASSSPTVQSWDIIVTTKEGSRMSSQDKWKITSYISGSRSVDDEIEELAPEVHSFPQISVATNISKNEALEGEIFCCLPLPFGAEAASTGLPVHVNGSFGLTDNRRDVKWKGIDQTNDLNARWNEALICTVLPSAYQCHIQSMIDSNLGSEEVYRCLPSIKKVKKNWKPAMKPLFDKLFDETPIFWTKANDGNWLKLSQSWFMNEDYDYSPTEMSGVAQKFLAEVGVNTVELPQHVFEAINKFEGEREINLVDPSTLYPYLRSNADHLDSESRKNKLLLLEYCLSTDVDRNCLQGIGLLPLADGTFGTFQTRNSHDVFLDSQEHPRILLPNLKDWFVEKDVETNVWKRLMDLAKKKFYQLKIFEPYYFQTNLKRALPQKWFAWVTESAVNWTPGRNEEPSLEWLQKLWSYLRKHFPNDLSQFQHFPIVPVRLVPTPILGYLGKEYKIMFRGKSMPQEISTSLHRDFSCVIIDDTPEFFHHNSLSDYIYFQTPSDILDFLTKQNSPSEIMRNFSDDLKDKWCQYLSNISSASYTEIPVLKSLPIFKAFQSSDRNHHFFINLKDNTPTYIEPKHVSDWIPGGIPFERPMVSQLGNGASAKLAALVGCKTLTMDELLASLMTTNTFNRFTSAQKDCLALWILNKTRFYNFKSLHSYLATLEVVPFDPTIDQRKTPKELFNPQISELQNLFLGEMKFPIQLFSSNDVLMALTELGLRNEPNSDEVYESALILHQSCNVMEIQNSTKKSKAIVFWLEKLLHRNNVSYHVSNNIRHVSFLEIQKNKPSNYPPSLEWAGSSNSQTFMCPNECWEQSKLELVASSIPVIQQSISLQLSNLFGWNIQKLGNVVQHMEKLSGMDKSTLSVYETNYVKRMSKRIYQFLKSLDETEINWILEQFSSFKWIWNGKGFSSPDTIVIDTQGLDLRPHAHSVLEDFKSCGDLFLKAGAHQTNSEAFLIGVLHSIKAVHDTPDSKFCKKDLEIAISILKWFADQKIKNDQILLPVQTFEEKLVLKPINICTFSESIRGFFEMDDEKQIYIAHNDISKNLAQSLGVQSQTKQLIKADSFGFEAYGQNEPLTQRIKNILDEYPDNMGIFKEMIQNADDAGASEVAFVIDHRTNNNQLGLIDPGMAACHGSALWSYNNSVFTDNDFANIQKLGGQTKKDVVEKIGRFGLGFNSVYHLTDVPSFVSGPFVAIFDPYTTHLNDIINDKTKPGVKINFVNNKHLPNICPGQFKPYQDLFGCKISTSPEPFDGTLFRLPFRQKPVDHIHQMSRKTYSDKSSIDDLIKELVKCPDVLLLFTQNVTKVTLFEIPRNESNGIDDMKQILEIEKKPLKYFKLIDSTGVPIENAKNPLSEQTNILFHAKIALDQESSSEIISSILFEISIKKAKTDMLKRTKWLVTNAVGNSEALEFARNAEGLMPCGGVAICLVDKENTLIPKPVKGQIFCFLPLSIPTDLPVHVNGAFSVASNRKNLWRVSQDSRHNWRGEWNQKLMADAVSLAYMSAIQHMARLPDQKLNNKMIDEWTKSFSSIFPLARREKNPYDEIDHLTYSLYKKMEKAKAKILPVMRRINEKLKIQWFQPTSEDSETKAYFGPISERAHFLPSFKEENRANVRDILIDLGFNQVHQSFDSLGSSFRNTGVQVEETKPPTVNEFLKNCRLKKSLPKRLQETEMLSLDRLINLMTYCLSEKVIIKKDESTNLTLSKQDTHHKKEPEEVSLDGLPLLLTKDNILRVFDEPVFESKYCDLVPAQHCRFLNGALQHLFSNHSVFGKKFELSDLQTMEQYIKDEMKNPKWILLFWKFLSDKMDTKKTVKLLPEQVAAMIPNWEVIPARRGNYPNQENTMMPFKNAKEIISVSYVDTRKDNFLKILRKLNCWELDFESLEKFQNVPQYLQTYHSSTSSTLAFTDLASKFTSSLDDYNGLCEVLGSLDIPLGYLASEESKTLLEYFEHEAPKLKPESLELLKTLPIFETTFGGHVPVSQLQIRVLEGNIPEEGRNIWLQESGSIFLRNHSTLAELYKTMKFKKITVIELYQQYIFHWLENMDDVSLMVHLKKLINIPFGGTKKATAALAPLKSYNLIGPNGFRRRVSEFFDPNVPDFKKLLPPHLLLPDQYNKIIPLLELIGLNSKLTKETFLAIAKDIESQGPSPPKAVNRGKLLVQHLYTELRNLHQSDKLHFSSFFEIASIKFIDAHKVPSALSKLHPQFSQSQLICFAEATTCEQENKTWTCSNLLPSWAKPSNKEIANFLKIFLEPPTEKVVEHCKNLCSSLSDRKKLETTEKENSEDLCRKLSEVMKDNYRFLSKHTDEPVVKELSKINCILVENGKKLIMPSKVVMEMSDDLRPYLYKFPIEMGEFQALFRALGTTKKPTLNQLSIVLASIHRDSRGEPLSPEERRIASKAISSFFTSFKEQGSESCNEIQILYLLSKKDVLLNSNQMMFNNEPKFTGRLSNTSNEFEEPGHLMLDLKLLKQLPVQLRPNFLSDEVHEKLCTEATDICPSQSSSCKLKNEIEKLISDHFFQEGLKRIICHVCNKADKEFSDDVMMKALEKIWEIQLECRPRIESELIHTINGQVVPESKKDLRYFVGEDKILIHHDDGDRFKIAEIMSTKIVDIFKDYIDLIECQHIIHHILVNEDPTNIQKILEEGSIEHLNAQLESKNRSVTLTLGQVIEDHLKHLLQQNPSHYFKTEELVGFEKDGVCILAKVLLELDEDEFEQRSNMGRKYLIDVGSSENVVASALDLYKFVRRHEDEVDSKDEIKIESFDVEDEIPSSEDSSFEVELYPGNEDSRNKNSSSQFDEATKDEKKPKFDDLPSTLEKAKDEIDEMLTEAWKLPEAEKNKAIKRLFLRWHPDKNPGKDALCTEAFKYLMNQLEHMKKSGSLNKDRSNASTESSSRSYDDPFWSYYGDFFKKWDSEAKQQGRQRNRHRQGRGYGFGARGNQPKSNPKEANRWMEQAKSDLANAKQTLNESSHDLTCFAAQQASEKALKALLLFIEGDFQSSHQLIYLAKRVEMRCPKKHQRFLRGIVDLAKQLSSIGQSGGDSDNLYDRSKCPSAHNSPQIPATAFQRDNAEIAIKLAEEIVQKASDIIF